MKMKPRYIILLVVLVIIVGLPLGAYLAIGHYLNYLMENSTIRVLTPADERYGVSEGMVIQDENITDIRMTVVPREYEVPDDLEPFVGGEQTDVQYLQVYYGYCLDGVWYDHPCEDYDLIEISDGAGERGWELAHYDHMVKIGPYLLISIDVAGDPDTICEVTDSLGSEVINPFTEYVASGYGLVAFSPNDEISNCNPAFSPIYYLLLEYDAIPDDYVLNVKQEIGSRTIQYSLTKDEIDSWVNG